jgi:eukaryotic-like serine/threonine-protein kinase
MLCPRCHREYEGAAEGQCRFDGEPLTRAPELSLVERKPTPDAGTVYSKRYIVRGLLGEGAMARVYLAEDALTHKLAAIKVLESPDARVPDVRERFFREVRTTEALEHPNIVRLLDAGQRRDGAPYLVMEYLFGESLGDLLRRQQRLDVETTLWIARDAAATLAAAHAAGVIHRDIKPDNIFLIGERSRPYALKVVDFGLARLQGQSGLTATGVTVGTLEYMAPEQTVKDATGPRTDIYGLGVVLYRMLTGYLPFGGSDTEVLAHQLISPPAPPSSLDPAIDRRIETVIMTAMRKLPRNRYPSMEDLLEDLQRLRKEKAGEIASASVFEADVYVPQSAYAKTVAAALYKKLNRPLPSWA